MTTATIGIVVRAVSSALVTVTVFGTLGADAASAAWAAEAAPTSDTIVLKAAHVFDSTGTELKSGASVVVRGERIVSVGTAPPPAGARVIDLGDATILPGFIDAHVHLTDEGTKDYYHDFYNGIMRFPSEQAHYAARNAKRTLEDLRQCAMLARTSLSTSASGMRSTTAWSKGRIF
jgi:imidazolonepropionase-like amidohydrolase